MDDYLLPNEEQINLMAEEYKKLQTSAVYKKDTDSNPVPIYLHKNAENTIVINGSIILLINGLESTNFGKLNKENLSVINQILFKNSVHIAKLFGVVLPKNDKKPVYNSLKQNLVDSIDLFTKSLKNLYQMREYSNNNDIDFVISNQLIACTMLQNMCL